MGEISERIQEKYPKELQKQSREEYLKETWENKEIPGGINEKFLGAIPVEIHEENLGDITERIPENPSSSPAENLGNNP